MSQPINIEIGTQFGQLTVLENTYKKGVGFLKVKCSCGNIEEKRKWPITSGKVKECRKCTDLIAGAKRNTGYKELSGTILGRIKRNAEVRGMKIEVSPEYLYNLYSEQKGICNLSGLEISLEKHDKRHTCTASLDRIDSKIGYIEGNLQWVHKDINIMKQDFEEQYFIKLCKAVSSKCG